MQLQALKITPAEVFSCELIEILRTPGTSTLESNKENILWQSPVPVTLRGMLCDIIKTGLYQ